MVKRIVTGIFGIGIWGWFFFLYRNPGIIFPNYHDFSYTGKVVLVVGWYIFCLGGPILISLLLPLQFKPKDLKLRIPKIDLGLTLKVIVVVFVANYIISWVITFLSTSRGTVISNDKDPFRIPQSVYIFYALVLAPFFEELFYRGLFIEFGTRLLKKKYIYLISAVFFGIAHLTATSAYLYPSIITFIGALMYSLQRELDNSLIPCMISHFLWNLMVLLSPHYPTLDFL